MIVATAGHVDHGKTSLIRQITGVDTDRLQEEKRRGLSISLGYAYLPREKGLPIGFVDVPGHHRFINTMIAGVGSIDLALLVIAADDGVMPQTREHLDVLRILGVTRIISVISKVDRVDAEQLAAVACSIKQLLQGDSWQLEGQFPADSQKGIGIDPIKAHLLKCATQCDRRDPSGVFRMSLDRVFHVKGTGLVVTGTVASGTVHSGDQLRLHPGDTTLRVRGLRVHDNPATTAVIGQRCALNLSGKGAVDRGNWLLGLEAGEVSDRLDVRVNVLETLPFSLKYMAPVKFYLGAQRVTGRLARFRRKASPSGLNAGDSAIAQLLLDETIPAFAGQRYLLRDSSEETLLGGGTILDPQGVEHSKTDAQRSAYLEAMSERSPILALHCLIEQDQVVDLARFCQAWNIPQETVSPESIATGRAFWFDGARWLTSQAKWSVVEQTLNSYLADWHRNQPHDPGIKPGQLKRALGESCNIPLLLGIMAESLRSGALQLAEGHISLPQFIPLEEKDANHRWRQIEKCLASSGAAIPLFSELADRTEMNLSDVKKTVHSAVKNRQVFRVSDRRCALPQQLLSLAGGLIELDKAKKEISVASAKQQWDAGRNLTVEILEYFDEIRFTQRQGNRRTILDSSLPERLFNA